MDEITIKVLNVEMLHDDGRPLRTLVSIQIGFIKIEKFRIYIYEIVEGELVRVKAPSFKAEDPKAREGFRWKAYVGFTDRSIWLPIERAITQEFERRHHTQEG